VLRYGVFLWPIYNPSLKLSRFALHLDEISNQLRTIVVPLSEEPELVEKEPAFKELRQHEVGSSEAKQSP
jgi:hypothetical protein